MSAVYPGLLVWKYSFEITPIYLTGGIAGAIPGSAMPIINLLQPGLFATIAVVENPESIGLDNWFAHFRPLPGATLGTNEVGHYPFANQSVAANAIIRHPLRISLLMECSVGRAGMTYWSKFMLMSALQSTLNQHDNAGGTYTVMTPSYAYQNCLRLNLQALPNAGEQDQNIWQWDFEQPLLTLSAAAQVYSNLMGKMGAQTPLTMGANGQIGWSGISPTTGIDTSGTAMGAEIPSASGTSGGMLPGSSGAPEPIPLSGADQSGASSNTSPGSGLIRT